MIKGIIFDLDGVICATDVYHYEAWKTVMREIGIEIDESMMDRLRGKSRAAGLELMLNDAGVTLSDGEKERLCDEKNALYKKLLLQMTEADLPEGNKTALYDLKKAGLKLAIGSASKNAGLVLERIGLGRFFDALSDGNGLKAGKPDPEVFLRAADMLGLSPSECLVVEDAQSGIDAAKNGGFIAVGVGFAAGYEKTDYPIESLAQIKEILGKRGEARE